MCGGWSLAGIFAAIVGWHLRMGKERFAMKRLLLAIAAVCVAAAWAEDARAQYVPPGGPVLPAELQYFRPRQGVLDNYNQFVAPRYELSNQLKTMERQQNKDYRALEEKLKKSDQLRSVQASATGTSAGFMNYSHYYGARGGGGARGRR